jgi:hypothetical protein
MPRNRLLFTLIVLVACGPFEPDPTGPGGGGPGPGDPAVAVPFRIGSINDEEIRAVASTGSDIVVSGWFTGTLDFDPRVTATGRTSQGGQDIFVARYSDAGELRWVSSLGGSDAEVPHSIAATVDGGVVVVGYGRGGGLCGSGVLAGQGGRDILIARFDNSGNCIWGHLVGGSDDDEARAVAIGVDGSIVVAGLFRGTADFAPGGATAVLQSRGGSDAFIARYDEDGTLIDVVQGGGSDDDLFSAVMITSDGDITAAGEFRGTSTFGSTLAPVVLQSVGGSDIVVARYTELMGLRWAVRAGGQGQDRATTIAAAPDQSALVAGTFEATVDLDGGPGAVLVVSRGAADAFVARYRADDGAWDGLGVAFGGGGSEGITTLMRHGSGHLILGGWFQESVDFDPGPGATIRVARGTGGGGDAFLAGFTPDGEFRWVTPIGATVAGQTTIAFGAAEDQAGTIWTGGRFYGRADFDPSDTAVELLATGASDAFLVRYSGETGALLVTPLPEE